MLCMGLQTSDFGQYFQINMAAEKTKQNKNLYKFKNKALILIDSKSLMTNKALIRSSVAYLAVKITETADKTECLRQIFHRNCFNYQG